MRGLTEDLHFITGREPAIVAAASDYVSLRNHAGVTVLIIGANDAAAVATVCTLQQATSVAGGSVKFVDGTQTGVHCVGTVDSVAGDVMAEIAVSSIGAWSTDATNDKNFLYICDVSVDAMDVANGFDVFRLLQASGDADQAVIYALWSSRYATRVADRASAIID